ncbi:MAG: archaellin/type IV pilin N-terminal domain-containing protein [archaeon]|jgi:flagellin-like protein
MISKKAISPIIATILLVVISLILVGILLSWSQNFTQKSTADADNIIDRKCIGADITISNCDYNALGTGTLSFIIINSGKVDFSEDENINLILIDDDQNLVNDNLDILDQNAFNRGDSKKIVITDYSANAPITIDLRSTQCETYFNRTSCN